MNNLKLYLVAVIFVSINHFIVGGTDGAANKFCRKADYETDAGYLNCVKLRRWKRQNMDARSNPGQPCINYLTLDNPNRRTGNIIKSTSNALCDRYLSLHWYRFNSSAGGKMPENCPPKYSCGTIMPIYLKDPHPTTPYSEERKLVCVSGSGGCCVNTWDINVVNCRDFFVYQLMPPNDCYMAYCAGEEDYCQEGKNSATGFGPNCTDNFPKLTGKAVLSKSVEGKDIKFYCDYRGPIVRDSFLIVEWYVVGDKSGEQKSTKVYVDEMIERRRSVLTEGYWQKLMGSTIYCQIIAKWKKNGDVPSKPIKSEEYFAGIKILNRVVNVSESGVTEQIQLKSTIPIKCEPEFEDNCNIFVEVDYNPGHDNDITYLDYSHNQQIVFGDCSVELNPNNWEDVHNITVKAVRDFRRDGNKRMLVKFKPILTTTASSLWNNYQLPNVEVVSSDVNTGMCQSYGDPHIVTFDKLLYHVYVEGEYVLYQNTRYRMKIHVRLERCETASCNCGLAVVVNDDIIVVDRCNRSKRNMAAGKNFPDGWNTLHRHALEQGASFVKGLRIFEHNEGRKYTIHTPSGSYVNFDVGDKWVRIDFYASSDDYNSTLGLCGTFDEDVSNEFTLRDGVTRVEAKNDVACGENKQACQFVQNWRVLPENSLFGERVNLTWNGEAVIEQENFCTCRQKGSSSEIDCDYKNVVFNQASLYEQEEGVDKTENVMIHAKGGRSKRGIDDNEFDDYFESEFLYDEHFHGRLVQWPTASGITEAIARKKCHNALFDNNAAINCQGLFNSNEIKQFMDSCLTDIKLSDGYDWLKSSLEPFISRCISNIFTNSSLWHPSSVYGQKPVKKNALPANTEAYHLLKDICPNSCWHKGNCVNQHCVCHKGYEGADCSIDSSTIPQNLRINGPRMCDIRKSDCLKLAIIGNNFLKKDSIVCRFDEIDSNKNESRPAEFMTFEKILCHLLPSTATFVKFAVNVLISNKSYEQSVGYYAVFDSKCAHCDALDDNNVHCFEKDNACSIDGSCYEENEANPRNCCEICSPKLSKHSFVKRNLPAFTLEPQSGTIELDSCDVTGKTIAEVSPPFECNFQFDVKWSREDCARLLGLSTRTNSVLVTVKKCLEATCHFSIEASSECSDRVLKHEYVIRVPGGTDSGKELCPDGKIQVETGPTLYWGVKRGGIRRFDFSGKHGLEGEVSYSIIKRTSDDISIDAHGEITYLAPNTRVDEQIMVLVERECSAKFYTEILITDE